MMWWVDSAFLSFSHVGLAPTPNTEREHRTTKTDKKLYLQKATMVFRMLSKFILPNLEKVSRRLINVSSPRKQPPFRVYGPTFSPLSAKKWR